MSFSQARFDELPIIGILRGFSGELIEPILNAAILGGLRNVEITMNSPGASEQIRRAASIAGGRANVGAGTVLDLAALGQALDAGANFVVTPTVQVDVIEACVRKKVPVFPGAFSPTEILHAWDLGATMVKIFPAETLGPGYIRSVKAPLPQVKLLPTGGVDLQSLETFVKAGADGFGIGNPLFDRMRVESNDWEWIKQRCAAFSSAYRSAKGLSSV